MIWFPIPAGDPGPVPITRDTTPLSLDEATRALYNRAISDPSSLTDQERRRITYRPPPEGENALCRDACGLSMDELIAKAINSKNNSNDNNNNNSDSLSHSLSLSLPLSYKEASLLSAGVVRKVQGQGLRILSEVARLSPEHRDLKERAMRAATTDDIRAAMEVAMDVRKRWSAERVLQSSSSSAGDSGSSSPSEAGSRFGLVVFYPENEEDEKEEQGRFLLYKSEIRMAIYHSLHYSPWLIKDETRNRFTLHWVAVPTTSGRNTNNNFQDPSALRSRFRTRLLNNKIPSGFRRDAFLYVDEEAFRSRETARPYLWLAEPEPEPEPESKPEHETGIETGAPPFPSLKVDIKHIAPTLFARLVQRDLQGEARRKPYRYTSELSRLHAATEAYPKWEHREGDGIWPPPSRMQ
ncbi:hypothetical protein BJX63DRAFT_411833 [Aspergillus granulosus]|uniref:Uncharacterized protein n=1 Tax=Aspergillus granulosus TaxID=176169 RepID=A0ABR4GWL2_9EURO